MYTEQPPEHVYLERNGRVLSGVKTGEGLQLTRLESTSPADYLRQDWQPGAVLPTVIHP